MNFNKILIKTLFIVLSILIIHGKQPLNITFNQSNEWFSAKNISKLEVQLKIKADEIQADFEKQEYQPSEMVIVLDTSGSMLGEKIQKSKDGIKRIIQALQKEDILHLISYNNDAEIVFSNGNQANKDELLEKLKLIVADGGTNLFSGLKLAISTIKSNLDKKTLKKRIFLFSDGLANIGVTNPIQISNLVTESEIMVSTFGVGEDCDAKLMKQISEGFLFKKT